jgi:hypothetical protein
VKNLPAKGIDGPDGGPREDEVDKTEPPGGEQRLSDIGTGVLEDGGGVEGNDVDYFPLAIAPQNIEN